MKKRSVIILSIFFIVLTMSCLNAQPPFQTSNVAEKSIVIESPVIEYHKLNQNFTFNLHAHNSTDGTLINHSNISRCLIHIYNPLNGEHLIEQDMTTNGNDMDFELEILGGNFSTSGEYSGYLYCEINPLLEKRGGFFQYSFIVNPEGKENTNFGETTIYIFLIVLFILAGIGFYMISKSIDYGKWYNSIVNKYKSKNRIKVILSGIAYSFAKETFLTYYIIAFPIIILFKHIIENYEITSMYVFLNVILILYAIGLLIVGFLFFGKFQEFVMGIVNKVKNMDWGLESE